MIPAHVWRDHFPGVELCAPASDALTNIMPETITLCLASDFMEMLRFFVLFEVIPAHRPTDSHMETAEKRIVLRLVEIGLFVMSLRDCKKELIDL